MDRGKAKAEVKSKSKSKTLGFTLYPGRKSEPTMEFLMKVQNLSLQPYQLGFQVCCKSEAIGWAGCDWCLSMTSINQSMLHL
jgi:hypothetical protein